MQEWPDECIDFIQFSPPYWGLRNYGESTETVWGGNHCEHEWVEERMTLVHENRNFQKGTQEEVHGNKPTTYIKKYDDKKAGFCVKCGAWKGQLGLEPTWQMYVEHMATVCRELKRVLKRTGSMYIVLGDTYATHQSGGKKSPHNFRKPEIADKIGYTLNRPKQASYQEKCLMGIPWRVAFALIDDGWILRNDIVWHKGNPMPGSQKDRLTQTCETIFHFVKNSGKALLWRNELTGEWRNEKPQQVYYHVETHELKDKCPSKEERYVVDEFGNRHLVWKPLWRGFDYYYELDAIREPHKTANEMFTRKTKPFGKKGSPGYRNAPVEESYGFNLRVRDVKRGKKGMYVEGGRVKQLSASEKEVENYVYPEKRNRDLETLKAYCLQEYEKATTKRMAYDHKGGLAAPESFKSASDWNRGTRETMNVIINSLDLPESVKSTLRTWWHDHQGHPRGKNPGDVVLTKHDLAVNRVGNLSYTDPLHVKAYHQKGKNPGDIFQTKKEPYIGNNPHRMRLQKEQHLALDSSKPMDLSHPKGKNPGDIVKTKNAQEPFFGHPPTNYYRMGEAEKGKNPGDVVSERVKANLEHFVPKGSGGHYTYGGLDSKKGKHYAEKGKNPGDVLNLTTDEISRLYGYNPDDICPTCGRSYRRHVSRGLDRKGVGGGHRVFIPCDTKGRNPGDFWTISTKPFKGAHFAVYPEAICVNPILSSCPQNGTILDPMCGSGTTLVVAKRLGRNYIGIDINAEYVEMAKKRLSKIPCKLDKFVMAE